jgi:hypothetical protein
MSRTGSRIACRMACVVSSLLLFTGDAIASGWGAYIEYGNSSGDVEFEDFGELPAELGDLVKKQDFDKNVIGIGMVYDTNIAIDKLFNYRIDVGWQHTFREGDNDDVDGNGLAIVQSFGFGIMRRADYRIWLGPVVRLNFDAYDPDVGDLYSVGIGAGPQLGLNYHLNEKISLSGTFAYQYLYVAEFLDAGNDSEPLSGSEHLISLNFSVLFRNVNDIFESGKSEM